MADERREYACPVFVCGWQITIVGPCSDADWAKAIGQHPQSGPRCTKRVKEMARLGKDIADRNEA